MKGKLITFEGIEASGKSTLSKMLFDWLKRSGVEAILTREPGGTAAGEEIRKILLNASLRLDEKAEALLYAASRRQLVKEVIKPALNSGVIVVCDRFSDSFFAYQGYARGIDMEFLKAINREATEGIEPNLTFLIDLSVEEAFKRIREKDRMELEGIEFHEKVRRGFLEIAKKESKRVVVLDGRKKPGDLMKEIIRKTATIVGFPA